MPQGFLAVFTEPGELVPLEEYHDWYDNEHIPLRVDHIQAFLAAARYEATDGITPKWLAVYDVADVEDFNKPSYTSLRTNRSAREGGLVKNLEMLDRRTYQLVGDNNKELTSSYHPKDPTKVLVTQTFDTKKDADALKWLDAVSSKLGEAHARTRIYDCVNNGKTGTKSSPDDQAVPKYLAIHGTCVLVCRLQFLPFFTRIQGLGAG